MRYVLVCEFSTGSASPEDDATLLDSVEKVLNAVLPYMADNIKLMIGSELSRSGVQ